MHQGNLNLWHDRDREPFTSSLNFSAPKFRLVGAYPSICWIESKKTPRTRQQDIRAIQSLLIHLWAARSKQPTWLACVGCGRKPTWTQSSHKIRPRIKSCLPVSATAPLCCLLLQLLFMKWENVIKIKLHKWVIRVVHLFRISLCHCCFQNATVPRNVACPLSA